MHQRSVHCGCNGRLLHSSPLELYMYRHTNNCACRAPHRHTSFKCDRSCGEKDPPPTVMKGGGSEGNMCREHPKYICNILQKRTYPLNEACWDIYCLSGAIVDFFRKMLVVSWAVWKDVKTLNNYLLLFHICSRSLTLKVLKSLDQHDNYATNISRRKGQ